MPNHSPARDFYQQTRKAFGAFVAAAAGAVGVSVQAGETDPYKVGAVALGAGLVAATAAYKVRNDVPVESHPITPPNDVVR